MSDQDAEREDLPEIPSHVPLSLRPAGAEQWSSTDDPLPTPALDDEGEDDDGYTAQDRQIIAAIEEGLKTDACTQIDGYGPHRLSAQVHGMHREFEGMSFSSVETYTRWIRKLVEEAEDITDWGRIEDESRGTVCLPNGERLAICLPPRSQPYPTFSLRKHTAAVWEPERFVEKGSLDERMFKFLQLAVIGRCNVLFVGEFGSGKTTLLRALADSFGDGERIGVVEQVAELALPQRLAMSFLYQPAIEGLGLADVLDNPLMYFGLDHLIVGEVHLEGITKMLEVMFFTEGGMSTYHAFSTDDAVERMKLGLQMENPNITSATAAGLIRRAFELIVVIEKIGSQRRVRQITEVDWRPSSGVDVVGGSDLFRWDPTEEKFVSGARRPDAEGRIGRKLLKRGLFDELKPEWFIEREHIERFKRRGET